MGDRSGRYPRDRDRDRDRRGRDGDRRAHDDRRAPNEVPRFTGRDDSRVNHEFSFEHSRQLPSDSYRPGNNDQRPSRAPPSGPRRGGRNGASRGRGGSYGRVGRDGRPFVFQAPVPAHERPILYFNTRQKTPELMAGMVPGSGNRFKEEGGGEGGGGEEGGGEDLEEGEGKERKPDTPMEMSDDEGGVGGEKVQMDKVEEEKPEKTTDVISMIRAFKKQATSTRNAVAENDDFIPFSFGDEGVKQQSELGSESEPEREVGRKMRRTNGGNRIVDHGHYRNQNESDPKSSSTGGFSHRDAHDSRVNDKKPAQEVGPPGPLTAAPTPSGLPPPPGLGASIKFKIGENAKRITADLPPKPAKSFDSKGGDMPWPPPPPPKDLPLPPPPPPPPPPPSGVPPLSDIPKKRKFDDMSDKKRGGPLPPDGNVKADWVIRPGSGVDPTPWVREGGDHSRCLETTDWLHKEITDFITYIQPCAYEHAIRRELIHRVRHVITNLWPDTDVRVFGSFAAELYLPTSDVDLVVLSKSYAEFDIPKYASQKSLRMVANALKKASMANYADIQVISKAKVPIVKFIDSITNIHVDISFENGSGLVANETFQRWKVLYPAMPILVVLIKHFLSMRGLNEVYHGGLGSFSVTCLVVSMLQLLPSVHSGAIDPRLHLGVMLLEFLELYGRNINTTIVGIRVDENSPGYFRKTGVFALNANVKPWQLSIQDPNDPDNDISKSSYMIPLILECFSDAHGALLRQMELLDRLPFEQRAGRSILGVILGGDYRSIAKVRDRLKDTYQSRFGSPDGDKPKLEMEESKGTAVVAKEKRERDMEAPKGAPKGPRAEVGEGTGRDHKKRRGPPRAAKGSVAGGGDGKREVIIID